MRQRAIYQILLGIIFLMCFQFAKSQAQISHAHPIEFVPKTYVCYKAIDDIKIDGYANEASWEKVNWTNDFVDIEGSLKPNPSLRTNVKMLWDKDAFYVFAKMEEPHVWAKIKERDAVIFKDDDFEIFIDPDGDGHHYFEIEMNAFNTIWDLMLMRPYRIDGERKVLWQWNINGLESQTHIEGSINNPDDIDKCWTAEIKIPMKVLKEFENKSSKAKGLRQWRVNFSRVDWSMDNKTYEKLKREDGQVVPEHNWVWSPTGIVNIHVPETWGYVQFSNLPAGSEQAFEWDSNEDIKWAMWNLYWQMKKYFKRHKTYSNTLENFTLLDVKSCKWNPQIYTTPNYFEIVSPSCNDEGNWILRKDGKIYYQAN